MSKINKAFLAVLLLLVGTVMVQVPKTAAADSQESTELFLNLDYQKSANIRVVIDGKQIMFDVDPLISKGRTLVPMRTIFEELGLTVVWDETATTAQGTSTDISVLFTIGRTTAWVNNVEMLLDVPASIIGGRTMIPLRFLSENMGYNVVWIGESNLILIGKNDIVEWRYEDYEKISPYKEYEAEYRNGIRTGETRFTGKFHEVKIVNLYSRDGRLVPNVPEFNFPLYGSGWLQQSPFAGRTFWVDIDSVISDGNPRFYNPFDYTVMDPDILRNSAPNGNYLKIYVDQHYFDLDSWKHMAAVNPYLSSIQDNTSLDGKEIRNYDTIFKVKINDKFDGLILLGDMIRPLLEPSEPKTYTVLEKDPQQMFVWSEVIWNKLKGEKPWVGMTKDMFLVQIQSNPDQSESMTTKFSELDLWVYENEYSESVYYFDDGVLTAMW